MKVKNKKLIIIVVVVLLICSIVACVGSVASYFFFIKQDQSDASEEEEARTPEGGKQDDNNKTDIGGKDNDGDDQNNGSSSSGGNSISKDPDDIYNTAMKKFQTDSYALLNEGSIGMKIEVPDFPEYTVNTEMDISEEAEVDIPNDKNHSVTNVSGQGVNETVEIYTIGDTVYAKTSSTEFKKYTKKEALDKGYTYNNLGESIFADYENYEYATAEGGTVNGLDTYKYTIELDEENIDDVMDLLLRNIGDQYEINFEDIQLESYTIEIYIAKKTQTITRTVTKVKNVRLTMTSEGIEMTVAITKSNLTSNFKDWGKEFGIKAPKIS